MIRDLTNELHLAVQDHAHRALTYPQATLREQRDFDAALESALARYRDGIRQLRAARAADLAAAAQAGDRRHRQDEASAC